MKKTQLDWHKEFKKRKIKTKLMPVANGKQIDWFTGWDGVKRLAQAYGKDWGDVGLLVEQQWAPRLDLHHIQFGAYVYRSLRRVRSGYYKAKRKKVPINETDLHYAIRMDRRNIEYILKNNLKSKPTKDFYKTASQMYQRIWKTHKKHIVGFANKELKK